MITIDEFIRFADSAARTLPGFDDFGTSARRYTAIVERYLPGIEKKMWKKARKFQRLGLDVPARYLEGGSAPVAYVKPTTAAVAAGLHPTARYVFDCLKRLPPLDPSITARGPAAIMDALLEPAVNCYLAMQPAQ